MPILQKMAKQIAKGDYEGYLSLPHDNCFEETMLEGLVIGALKLPYPKLYPLVGSFVDKIENWMVCDCFCNALKSVKRFPEDFWEYTSFLLQSDNPWHIRTGLVLMLDYFLDGEHISEVLSRCDAVTNPHYYVQMAQAWLVSMAYVKFPAITEEYLSHCKLDSFTYNKALTKACESRCVTEEQRAVSYTHLSSRSAWQSESVFPSGCLHWTSPHPGSRSAPCIKTRVKWITTASPPYSGCLNSLLRRYHSHSAGA